ncbi:filamentous hemagglutinin N-terminal domain-containing protein [Pantanalinema rosaneae CENA516]|uniref:two-partner secretion domain-containing protein n=1 Tax=Pantanalinema rosaneae TaxID=1620701 RepID=UPI003D6FE7B5
MHHLTCWRSSCQILCSRFLRLSLRQRRQIRQWLGLLLFMGMVCSSPAAVQSSPIQADSTSNSIVTPDGNLFVITGGTTVGNRLFHSFQAFSVPTGSTAWFNQPLAIQTILTRVTGTAVSTIDGIIRANGTANVFLLNPQGIVFGANARLDIGGSFLATTADRFQFADGSEFSATNPQPPPLLTMNVPIGLQFGANPGRIVQQSPGLAVRPGQTLGLLGGDVALAGGSVIAASGRVELGSVQEAGVVTLTLTPTGFMLGYPGITTFGDIQLSNRSEINTSGGSSGAIQLQGRSLQLREDARILSFNLGTQPGGALTINMTDAIDIVGTGNYDQVIQQISTGQLNAANARNMIATIAAEAGAVGEILINTRQLRLQNGAYITSVANSSGQPGSLTVNATDIELNQGLISSLTFFGSQGNSAEIMINTDRLTMQENSFISTATLGIGSSGNLTIQATDRIHIVGDEVIPIAIPNLNSITTSIATNGLLGGRAGDLTLTARQLVVTDGAKIVADSNSLIGGGNVTIRATDAISLMGTSPDLTSPTLISARGFGDGGNLTLQAGTLTVEQGAGVSVLSQGAGTGGNLTITANSIRLNNRAFLEAASLLGTGGNVQLHIRDVLLLRHQSRISSSAGLLGGTGNGGNIAIAAQSIVASALENSDITANALGGQGGRIQIRTQGLFGMAVRPRLTPLSDITASSQFGVQGAVTINSPNLDPSGNLIQLPSNFLEVTNGLDQRCDARGRANSFVISGRGGLPPTPQEVVNAPVGWQDDLQENSQENHTHPQTGADRADAAIAAARVQPDAISTEPLIEATHWVTEADGTIVLVAPSGNQVGVNPFGTGCSTPFSLGR